MLVRVVECRMNVVERMAPVDDLIPSNKPHTEGILEFLANVPEIVRFSCEGYVVVQKPVVLELMVVSLSLPTLFLRP